MPINTIYMKWPIILSLLLMSSCYRDDNPALPGKTDPVLPGSGAYEQGALRIKVSDELAAALESKSDTRGVVTSPETVVSDKLFSELGVTHMERTFPHAGQFEDRTRAEGLHLWYDVTFNPEIALTRAGSDIGRVERILKVEYLPQVRPFRDTFEAVQPSSSAVGASAPTFNDPLLGEQWHYYNDGSLPKSLAGSDINVAPVWKEITTGNPDVIVAVVDGGIETNHEDLRNNMWINRAEQVGERGVDDDHNGYIDDIYGYNFVNRTGSIIAHDHGTHVAGTIAAENNNGIGVAGVAGGDTKKGKKGVRLMSCQIVSGNSGNANLAAAIKYGADNGAVISQNSWAYDDNIKDMLESEKAAIDYFIKYAGMDKNGNQTGPMKGGLVIFAAGNENSPLSYPGAYSRVLSVSAIAGDYVKASYSNYGAWVDLAAPGGDTGKQHQIMSTLTNKSGKYGKKMGSSMACPHVTGVAALLISEFGKKEFTPYMLKSMLLSSSKNIDSYNPAHLGKLGRLVDAYNAFTRTSDVAPDRIADLSLTVNSNNVILRWTVPHDADDGKPLGFDIYYSDRTFDTGSAANIPSHVRKITLGTEDAAAGESFEAVIDDLEFNKKYYLSVDAYDLSGNRSAMSQLKETTTGSNSKPIVTPGEEIVVVLKSHETYKKDLRFSDPDLHSLTYGITPEAAAIGMLEITEGLVELSIDALKTAPGSYQTKFFARDKYGLEAGVNIRYTVGENHTPVASGQFKNVSMRKNSEKLRYTLSDFFTDADGEQLAYSCSADKTGVALIDIANGVMTLSPGDYGMATITVTASDARGASASINFKVLVSNVNNEIDIYPNPVVDHLNIRVFREVGARVKITGTSGKTMFDKDVELSPFEPTRIDMSAYGAGAYRLTLVVDGKQTTQNIVKL